MTWTLGWEEAAGGEGEEEEEEELSINNFGEYNRFELSRKCTKTNRF